MESLCFNDWQRIEDLLLKRGAFTCFVDSSLCTPIVADIFPVRYTAAQKASLFFTSNYFVPYWVSTELLPY
jgi:hypothetical protein